MILWSKRTKFKRELLVVQFLYGPYNQNISHKWNTSNIGKFCVYYYVKLKLTSYLLTNAKIMNIVRWQNVYKKIVNKYQLNYESHIIINAEFTNICLIPFMRDIPDGKAPMKRVQLTSPSQTYSS